MINKIKSLIQENRMRQKQIYAQTQEIEWAKIFSDSIKGVDYLEKLPLNIGRWAGNYSFFYVLNRILMDYKPKSILEFGLGESSKFVSTYLDNYLLESSHTIIEHDEFWKNAFTERFQLSERSKIILLPLEEVQIFEYKSNCYKNLGEKIKGKFDLYIIDAPFGTARYSRYDIVKIVERFNQYDEFIIIIDDYNREGEKDTAKLVMEALKTKSVSFTKQVYSGTKSQILIASERYKFATSL